MVRLPPSNSGGSASRTSSVVTSANGFRMRVLKDPPMRDSSIPGMRGFGKAGVSFCSLESSEAFFFDLRGGFGKTIVMAVSRGTHPGWRQETCITMTDVPISNAFSGMVASMHSITLRLC